jgi:hypothetical protein
MADVVLTRLTKTVTNSGEPLYTRRYPTALALVHELSWWPASCSIIEDLCDRVNISRTLDCHVDTLQRFLLAIYL